MERHILSCTYINYKLKILKKRYQEKWENAYLTLKMRRALWRALDPRWRMLASLTLWRCAPSSILREIGWAPSPNQILDPHLLFCGEDGKKCKFFTADQHLTQFWSRDDEVTWSNLHFLSPLPKYIIFATKKPRKTTLYNNDWTVAEW